MAMASRAIEIRSPAVSSMSSSRAGGSGLTWLARSISSSVESPIADTTTTTWSPPLRVATIRCATRLIPSASATDEPPYFCTMSATNGRTSRVGMDLEFIRYRLVRSSATSRLACATTACSARRAAPPWVPQWLK